MVVLGGLVLLVSEVPLYHFLALSHQIVPHGRRVARVRHFVRLGPLTHPSLRSLYSSLPIVPSLFRKVDIILREKEDSSSHGARPVY